MSRVEVYARVNRERLLGTMERWSAHRDATHYRALTYPGFPEVISMNPGAINRVSVETVTFERVTKVSEDGWEAKVVVVTDAPLSALGRLRDFRPAFDYRTYDCGAYPRAYYYDGVRC
ncbi:hypothetical protein HU230_0012515 [Bradyrhizobium quebecense]|uniref:Uncharacterized protein n=1 Tax=Bradyrhizobium quebecense TaxID=2748629 RepID=A0A973WQ64_9BRAD|nr:hypothetical protein [Bradyrhizobium quebecense]UGA46812.1 hypothetical protein HU230_0012515 [Bradyrhizobium quebecense]